MPLRMCFWGEIVHNLQFPAASTFLVSYNKDAPITSITAAQPLMWGVSTIMQQYSHNFRMKMCYSRQESHNYTKIFFWWMHDLLPKRNFCKGFLHKYLITSYGSDMSNDMFTQVTQIIITMKIIFFSKNLNDVNWKPFWMTWKIVIVYTKLLMLSSSLGYKFLSCKQHLMIW